MEDAFVNVKRHSLSVSLDGFRRLFSFDRKGRLIGASVEGRFFQRGLDNRIVEKGGSFKFEHRRRRELEPDEKKVFLDGVHLTMGEVHDALRQGKLPVLCLDPSIPDPAGEARAWFERILLYDFEGLEVDAAQFRAIYRSIGILPPDQYLALVLQAAEGCLYNRCTFCNFYRGRPFRMKTEEEFRRHIDDVKGFFGEALGLRRSIFLGDANALVIPQRRLLPIFDLINQTFPLVPPHLDMAGRSTWKSRHPVAFEGVYSFIDVFSGKKKSRQDFEELAARGLRRVYIGLETGWDELLRFLKKPGTSAEACELVSTIKAGGVTVGIIVMIGVGGDLFWDGHVRETIKVLNAMQLGQGDLLYFSEFIEHPESEYAQMAKKLGVKPLTRGEIWHQMEEIRAGLRFPPGSKGPKVSVYDIREFLY